MPIYAYKCQACGHAKDVLQKMSDPVLTDCPACGKSEFQKQLTAAGFQLKGSGWYVTDFRGGGSAEGKGGGEANGDKGTGGKSDAKSGDAAGQSETKSDQVGGTGSAASTAPAVPSPAAAKPAPTSNSTPASSST